MSAPIKAGDMVQVVRCHCAKSDRWLGHVFQVVKTGHTTQLRCTGCEEVMTASYADRDDGGHYSFEWLKRIPPASELEGERTQEDIREPELQGIDYADI